MVAFLKAVGILLIIAGIVLSVLFGPFGLLIFPAFLALGSIILGLGKVIELLHEINNKSI